MAAEANDGIVDAAALLDRTGGDVELARELVSMMLADLPKLCAGIRAAVAARDAPGLQRAAHTLKGAVANFSAARTVDAAQHVEVLGRGGQFTGMQDAVASLEREVERLTVALPKMFPGPAH